MEFGVSHMRLIEIAYSYCKNELLSSYAILLPKIMHAGPLFADLGITNRCNITLFFVYQLLACIARLIYTTVGLPSMCLNCTFCSCSAHFKQSYSENTVTYKHVWFLHLSSLLSIVMFCVLPICSDIYAYLSIWLLYLYCCPVWWQ